MKSREERERERDHGLLLYLRVKRCVTCGIRMARRKGLKQNKPALVKPKSAKLWNTQPCGLKVEYATSLGSSLDLQRELNALL